MSPIDNDYSEELHQLIGHLLTKDVDLRWSIDGTFFSESFSLYLCWPYWILEVLEFPFVKKYAEKARERLAKKFVELDEEKSLSGPSLMSTDDAEDEIWFVLGLSLVRIRLRSNIVGGKRVLYNFCFLKFYFLWTLFVRAANVLFSSAALDEKRQIPREWRSIG